MLSLYKLEIFAQVVEAGSFSAAADRMLMSQSAVSQHIQDLEASLGTKLFNRGRRGVTLTPAGASLHRYTQEILRLVAEAENAVTDVDHLNSGQVIIGATPGVSVYLLPEWIQDFRARYPHLTAALQTDVTPEIVNSVLDRRLDIGFIEGELAANEAERLGQLVLQDIDLYIIVGPGHPWWQLTSIPAAQLAGQQMVTRQPRSKTRQWIDTMLRSQGVQLEIVAELDNPEAIKRSVMSGMGIAMMPEYTVRNEIAAQTLSAVAIDNLLLRRTLKLVWDAGRPFAPITRAFLTHLATRFPLLLTVTD